MALSPEQRIQAEEQVDAFIQVLSQRYRFKEEDIPEILDNIKWISNHRNGLSRITWSAGLAIVTLGVSGIVLAMFEGIKHYLKLP